LLILENLAAIEKWLDGLNPEVRRRLNHPAAIWDALLPIESRVARGEPSAVSTYEYLQNNY
jgi:hypothetical protein